MINCRITASIYSQSVSVMHNGCIDGQLVRAYLTIPVQPIGNLMGIIEQRISSHFENYCEQPEEGPGVFMATKDIKIEQECQHVCYDFYLTLALVFMPLLLGVWV